jgi:hypothetical protein
LLEQGGEAQLSESESESEDEDEDLDVGVGGVSATGGVAITKDKYRSNLTIRRSDD